MSLISNRDKSFSDEEKSKQEFYVLKKKAIESEENSEVLCFFLLSNVMAFHDIFVLLNEKRASQQKKSEFYF